MKTTIQNMPLAIDPASKDQTRVNRELTEVIRQLWQKIGELQQLRETDAETLKQVVNRLSSIP